MNEPALVWIVLAPLIGAGVALAGKLIPEVKNAARVLAAASLLPAAAMIVKAAGPVLSGQTLTYSLGGWPEPVGISLVMDGAAWISAALSIAIGIAVAVYSLAGKHHGADFFFFLMMAITGMMGVAVTGDLFTMFVLFEIIAVAVYVLIAWERTATGLAASFKYLMLSSTGILFFLLGIFLVYRETGVLSISMVAGTAGEPAAQTHVMHLALACLCVGIGVRTAFIPFHTWLPEAHAYAPHPISALLSGALIKVSLFAMIRIITAFSGQYLYGLLMWIGAATALLAVISALAQTDVKRLLAYHSISQLGYMLAVFGAASSIALTASFFHAVNHALFKSLLFLTVGAAVNRTQERNLFRMGKIGREMPVTAVAFFVGALSISGIPPFNGFASKALITQGMKGSPAYPLLWMTGFLTIASFIKLSRIFLPGAHGNAAGCSCEAPEAGSCAYRNRIPFIQTAVTTILALACIATGVFGERAAAFLGRMLAGSAGSIPSPFTRGNLLGTLPAILLGVAAYRLILTDGGRRLSTGIKAMAPGLRTVLVFFFAGLLAFAAAAY